MGCLCLTAVHNALAKGNPRWYNAWQIVQIASGGRYYLRKDDQTDRGRSGCICPYKIWTHLLEQQWFAEMAHL